MKREGEKERWRDGESARKTYCSEERSAKFILQSIELYIHIYMYYVCISTKENKVGERSKIWGGKTKYCRLVEISGCPWVNVVNGRKLKGESDGEKGLLTAPLSMNTALALSLKLKLAPSPL